MWKLCRRINNFTPYLISPYALLVKLAGGLNRETQMEEIKNGAIKSPIKIQKRSVKERIVAISNEIRISKAGKNEFMKANYFQPDDILRTINPLLESHQLISIFNMEWLKEKEMYQSTLEISDVNSLESVLYKFDIPMQELKGAGRAQSAGATQTYAKRYMFMNAFNLADNKSDLDHSKNKPAEEIDWAKKLKGAKNLEELKSIFASMPQQAKLQFTELKDILKDKFNENINLPK